MYASFGRRTIAFILDAVFYSVFTSILSQLLGLIPTGMLHYNMLLPWLMIVVAVMSWLGWLIGFLCYYAWAESSPWQATLGKKIMGIKVTDINGERFSFSRSFCRQMAIPLSFLPLGIGIFKYWSNQKRQCWHDKITDCLVVEKNYTPEPEPQVLPPVSKGLKMFFYFLCLIPLVCWLALGIIWKQLLPQMQQLQQQNPEKTKFGWSWNPSQGFHLTDDETASGRATAPSNVAQPPSSPQAPAAEDAELRRALQASAQLKNIGELQILVLQQNGRHITRWQDFPANALPDRNIFCLIANTRDIPSCPAHNPFALMLSANGAHAYRTHTPDMHYQINWTYADNSWDCRGLSDNGKKLCSQWFNYVSREQARQQDEMRATFEAIKAQILNGI